MKATTVDYAFTEICDNDIAAKVTLELLASEKEPRVLRIRRHPERPVTQLILCHRTCQSNPAPDIVHFVQALSSQDGFRSYNGDSCKTGVYIGNNVWGSDFEKKSIYCPHCGYSMDGPVIDHVEIVASEDNEWNETIKQQCERGAYWENGQNYGVTYEFVQPADQ